MTVSDFEFTITETSSMVDLEEYLNYLIIERSNEIYYKIINHNAEYQNLQAEMESCFAELLQALPEPKHQKIVNEKLWSIIGMLGMLLPRVAYRQAIQDGMFTPKSDLTLALPLGSLYEMLIQVEGCSWTSMSSATSSPPGT